MAKLTMKKKLFVALYVTAIVISVAALNAVVMYIRQTSTTPQSREEVADIALAQYLERPNATTSLIDAIPFFLLPFASADTQALQNGCGLRLSFSPKEKAVASGDTITYIITFTNQGKEVCRNVSLSIYYTDKEHYISSDPEPTASDYYFNIGELSSREQKVITLVTRTTYPNGVSMGTESCATADNSPDICANSIIFVNKNAAVTTLPTSILSKSLLAIRNAFNKKELGIWVWDTPYQMTPVYAQQVAKASRANGFNVIYISVDDYLAISQIKNKDDRDAATKNYMDKLEFFIKTANAQGLAVDAVCGGKDWAMSENRWKGYTIIDFVKSYNESHPQAPLRGLQYDVEPYLLSTYNYDKRKVLKEYLQFIEESTQRLQDVPIGFTVVIPHFYDREQKWTPSISYDDTDAYTFTHLLNILKEKDDTTIIIMAYRNYFNDENGTKQISEAELREAQVANSPTRIIIAQETGNVQPDYVTFYDYPKSSVIDSIKEIRSGFGDYTNFAGVAIHYFDSYMKME